MVITEKIDGTNACVIVTDNGEVGAQSRNRLLPMGPLGMDDLSWRKRDNAGFGEWVGEHSEALASFLGPGYHYGEWWGSGIGRKYGLEKGDKRFSLFNSHRWGFLADPIAYASVMPSIPGIGVVPVLHIGPFDTEDVQDVFWRLMDDGSSAAPGFMSPEGIVIYHNYAKQYYKMTDNGDIAKRNANARMAA